MCGAERDHNVGCHALPAYARNAIDITVDTIANELADELGYAHYARMVNNLCRSGALSLAPNTSKRNRLFKKMSVPTTLRK